jgi:UDP-glucuronate decarboxylase
MKRVLVAGGAGFIGSHLCDRLLDQGHSVLCLDNFLTGDKRNVEAHRGNPRFELIDHDITQPFSLRGQIDQIFNLACPASPVHYSEDPHYTVMISVLGVSNLLKLAEQKSARLLHASTSEVYGDPLHHPQSERDNGNVNCTGPRACYDEGKRCAETLLFDAWRRDGADIKVVRIFNTYGPRMQEDDGRVVSNFIVQALSGGALTIYGDGSQTRSFCYVDDLLDGLLRLMASPKGFTGPVNLGNPEEVSVVELAERITEIVGNKRRIEFRPLPVDDPKRRRPDISLARARLGFEPSTPLEQGLARTVAYFREKLRERDALVAPQQRRRARGRLAVAPA